MPPWATAAVHGALIRLRCQEKTSGGLCSPVELFGSGIQPARSPILRRPFTTSAHLGVAEAKPSRSWLAPLEKCRAHYEHRGWIQFAGAVTIMPFCACRRYCLSPSCPGVLSPMGVVSFGGCDRIVCKEPGNLINRHALQQMLNSEHVAEHVAVKPNRLIEIIGEIEERIQLGEVLLPNALQ